ncbi:hypothetical protein AB1K62_05160 [Parasphingorhabdus sp. JC815]|uniref:hypothetical protein n=1 Tax=Parasphingorhabdus sp. JC815 TaxID=3232140 RepID=UPI0034581C59
MKNTRITPGMSASNDVNNYFHLGYISVIIGTLAYSVVPLQSAMAKNNRGEIPVIEDSDDPQYDSEAAPEKHRNIKLEYRLNELEARLDAQATQLENQQRIIERQAQVIAEQGRGLQDQMLETKRLRVALAGQGKWDAIDRTLPQSGRFQTVQLSPQPQLPQEQTRQDLPAQPVPSDNSTASGQADSEDRPQSDKAVDQLLLDQGGVLLPAGKFQLEPSIDYTSISSDRVNISGFSIFNAIVIGSIRVDDVNRDIITGALTARYGLARRVQVDVRVPYVYRNDTETTGIGTGDATERRITGNGLGDVGLTLAWQPFAARGWRPATIFRLQAEFPTGKSAFEIERIAPEEDSPERILTAAPTGSGFYTISPGVTFVWPIDPVVLFAGGSFNYTFKRRFDEFGLIEPGHGFEFFTGMNMSINERVSMNFSFLDKQRFATRSNGVKIPGSGTHDARLSLGTSIGLTDKMSLVFSAANGLTDESPDFTFSVRLPIIF